MPARPAPESPERVLKRLLHAVEHNPYDDTAAAVAKTGSPLSVIAAVWAGWDLITHTTWAADGLHNTPLRHLAAVLRHPDGYWVNATVPLDVIEDGSWDNYDPVTDFSSWDDWSPEDRWAHVCTAVADANACPGDAAAFADMLAEHTHEEIEYDPFNDPATPGTRWFLNPLNALLTTHLPGDLGTGLDAARLLVQLGGFNNIHDNLTRLHNTVAT